MPRLDWIGKAAVENHHDEVPYRLIHCDGELSAGDPEAGNLLVEGDNLEALRALLPYYAGQVKCIYIDPPYNTGNEKWVYNDNVSSPEIEAWLGKVVGPEAEDLSRHDKWLSMMYPRLRLLREFLREDGVIFVSIDDNEVENLTSLLNEVLGKTNWLGTIVWKNVTDNNPTRVVIEHEYIVSYARQKSKLPKSWKSPVSKVKDKLVEVGRELLAEHDDDASLKAAYQEWFRGQKPFLWPLDRYKYIDRGGVFTGSQSVHNPGREGYRYDLVHPVTGKPCKEPAMGYRFPEETARVMEAEGRFIYGATESKIVELKLYASEYADKLPSVINMDGRIGSNDLGSVLHEKRRAFDYPKPKDLIAQIVSFVTGPGDLVLDSFAGSGTTGHAVLDLNAQDGGERRFILVEMQPEIARDVTAERLRRVIEGYDKGGDSEKPVPGLGGGFRHCRLGTPLFDEFGDIRSEVTFPDLAAHVFFSETGVPIPARATSSLLGVHDGRAVYLLFDAALSGTPREAAGNVLTPDRLVALPPRPEGTAAVVYAEGCTASPERLRAHGASFRQIPYQIAGAG